MGNRRDNWIMFIGGAALAWGGFFMLGVALVTVPHSAIALLNEGILGWLRYIVKCCFVGLELWVAFLASATGAAVAFVAVVRIGWEHIRPQLENWFLGPIVR